MQIKLMIPRIFKSSVLPILIALLTFLQTSCLEASGWGVTKESSEFEGVSWNGAYMDLVGLHLTASIPNYSGALLQNGLVVLQGSIEDFGYGVITTFNQDFSFSDSKKEFVKMIEKANPGYSVKLVKNKGFTGEYIVDLIPLNQEENPVFWRFLSTKNRIVQMGTTDLNEKRRSYFFESIEMD